MRRTNVPKRRHGRRRDRRKEVSYVTLTREGPVRRTMAIFSTVLRRRSLAVFTTTLIRLGRTCARISGVLVLGRLGVVI